MAGAPHLAFAYKHTRGEGEEKKDVKIFAFPPPSSPPLIYDFYPRNIPPPSRPFPTYPTAEKKRFCCCFFGGLGGRNIAEFPFQSIPELKGSKIIGVFLKKKFCQSCLIQLFYTFSFKKLVDLSRPSFAWLGRWLAPCPEFNVGGYDWGEN